ncbi:RNA-binding protein, partial [Strigomonas culicis]
MSTPAVIVSGLPADLTQESLQDYFSRVGPVVSVELLDGGRARVTLEREEDLEGALDLSGAEYREGVVLDVQVSTAAAPADDDEKHSQTDAKERKPRFEEGKAIVVRGLAVPLREQEKVREIFGPCGEITDLYIDSRGRFVYLSFATTEAADTAVARSGEELEGSAIDVQLRRSQTARRQDVRLTVKHLPVGATEAQVKELFSTVGVLTDTYLKADQQLCFISYATAEEADRAMALQGREIGGNRVEVERREKTNCFLCGKEGHIGSQCRSMTCHSCGRQGHKA